MREGIVFNYKKKGNWFHTATVWNPPEEFKYDNDLLLDAFCKKTMVKKEEVAFFVRILGFTGHTDDLDDVQFSVSSPGLKVLCVVNDDLYKEFSETKFKDFMNTPVQ